MKRKHKILASRVIVLLLVFTMTVTMMPVLSGSGSAEAGGNPYPWYNWGNTNQRSCTSVAWQCVKDNLGVELPAWSDGVTWLQGAKNSGIATGNEPRVGAVAVWDGGVWNRDANRYYGHVAYVTGVQNANSFTVTEGGRSDIAGGIAYGYTMWNHPVGSNRPYCSNQWLIGFIYPKAPPVVKPDTPTNVKISNTDPGIGDAVSASWSASARATGYTATLVCTTNSAYNQTKAVGGTSVSFAVNNPGTYKVQVYASNSAGNSGTATSSNSATVHKNVSVKYVDWDGAQIGPVQSVKYGGNAAPPVAPTREGYTFQRWSSDGKGVKADTTITAEYKINTYSVSFVDYNGDVIGSVQKIEYGSAATPPEDVPAKTGYVFSEWSTDEYKNVKKSLTVKAVYVWGNVDLPIVTEITSAKRNAESTGYDIAVKLTNFPNDFTKGKLVAALMTKDGKMVASETKSISKPAGTETNETMTILYSGVVSFVEVSMVGVIDDETTGTPKAKSARAPVDIGNEWSDWSTTVPEGDDLIKESRTEYRYKDRKVIKQTTAPATPSGYTLTNTANTGTYTAWGGWSGYSTAAVGKNNLTDVSTTTGYRYYAFRCGNCGTRDPYSGACSNCGSYNMAWVQDYGTCTGQSYGGGYTKMDNNKGRIWWQNCYWYFEFPGTSDGQGGYGQPTTTLYRYRTRQEYKNYTYWRTDWTNWSPTAQTASDDKQVETRKTYRFKNNGTEVSCYNYKRYKFENVNTGKTAFSYTSDYADKMGYPGEWEYNRVFSMLDQAYAASGGDPAAYGTKDDFWYKADVNDESESTVFETKSSLEDSVGTKRVQEGTIENAAGKVATLMVYKGMNEDPTASQIEYIGQTVLNDEGKYCIEYVTKEEPSAKTGDFMITLGVEGATNYMLLGKIEAPKAVYTVNFVDDQGNQIGEQKKVVSGGSVEAPQAPAKEGCEFIGWDTALRNITENLVVTAQYRKKNCTVIFVDWDNNALAVKDFEYGDTLTAEAVPTRAGKAFSKWIDESGNAVVTVTDNMIVTADYVDAKYTVQFTDWDGNVISSKQVSYGDSVTAPEALEAPSETKRFAKWSAPASMSFVSRSMVVTPVAEYLEDSDAPEFTLASGTYKDAQKVGIYSLNADPIYYSVQPIDQAQLLYDVDENEFSQYKSQITVSESSVILAYAKAEGKNRSEVQVRTIKIGEDDGKDVEAAADAILAIPDTSLITLDDETKVSNAKSLYDALSPEKQAQLGTDLTKKLNDAIAKIAQLKEAEENSEEAKADKAAADAVSAKINALPAEVTKADGGTIAAARAAYTALTANQKKYVPDATLGKLLSAENAYQAILDKEEADQQAAEASKKAVKDVKDKISALPEPETLTLSDEAAVQAAMAAYEQLNDAEREQIESTLVSKLNVCAGRIDFLKQQDDDENSKAEADQAAADAVIELINALPAADEVDWNTNRDQIENAKAAFDKLTPDQKDLIPFSASGKLDAAVSALDEQDPRTDEEKQEAADRQAVENVTALVNSLPDVNSLKLVDKTRVEYARKQFGSLTEAQLGLLSVSDYRNLDAKITAAEEKLASLEKEAEKTLVDEDQIAADAVAAKIRALPAADKLTLNDQGKVLGVLQDFSQLSETAQSRISRDDLLTLKNATDRIIELQNEAEAKKNEKKANPFKVKVTKKTVKFKKVKKKAQKVAPLTVTKAQGTVTFKGTGTNKKSKKALKINSKTGKITVKKKTKKGTYTMKVTVTAAGNSKYLAGKKTVTVKIKVK